MLAFGASIINTLPLLLANSILRPTILDSKNWPTSDSDTLRDAHSILMYMAQLIQDDERSKNQPRS